MVCHPSPGPNQPSICVAHLCRLCSHTNVHAAGNSFATFPDEGIRNAAIILLVAHTCVAFMLFIMPLYML